MLLWFESFSSVIIEFKMNTFLALFLMTWTGFFIFQLTLAMLYIFSTFIGLSCIQGMISTFFGLIMVMFSNYTASLSVQFFSQYCEAIKFSTTAMSWDMFLCTNLIILLVYLLSGGRPSQLLPSHVACPGAFAREYVLVDNRGLTPSPSMKQRVQKIGMKRGCHHCGKFSSSYISDHMPPTVLYSNKQFYQRLYPQCKECSLFQGGKLSKSFIVSNFSRKGVISYPWKMKKWLFWMPYFLLIEYLFGASENMRKSYSCEFAIHFWKLFSV